MNKSDSPLEQFIPPEKETFRFEYRITLIYVVFASIWIIFTDMALENMIPDQGIQDELQTSKGILFVTVTALLLFFLVRRQMQRISQQQLNFESMFHTIDDGVVITSTDRKIVLVNKGLENMFGYKPEELMGKTKAFLYSKPEEFIKAGDLLFGEHSEKNSAIYISYYRDREGGIFPGETHGTKMFDNKGKWIGNVAVIRNISDRMSFIEKIEKALEKAEQSEHSIRATLDSMLEGCQIIGFDWTYHYANNSATVHLEKSREELLGNRFDETWKGIAPAGLFRTIGQCMTNGISVRGEYEFNLPDGPRWFDTRIQRIPEGLFILWVDVTKRKLAEAKMMENELRFKKVYEAGPFGMAIVSNEMKFTYANATFCRMLGYTEHELRNRTISEITHPEDAVKDGPNMKLLTAGEIAVYKTEKRYLRKDGGIAWGALTASAIRDSSGQFLYYLAIIEDIGDRKSRI